MTGKSLFGDDERAVSPVIGVILMVAITVILAAVIGTFVLNLGGSVQENVQAGASVSSTSGSEVKVTWTSNQNANDLVVDITGCTTGDTTLNNVGETFTTSGGSCSSDSTATVIVTALGDGDSKTVIVNKDVEF
jgi:flagellin-like protein